MDEQHGESERGQRREDEQTSAVHGSDLLAQETLEGGFAFRRAECANAQSAT
jgi:hypothetical protein